MQIEEMVDELLRYDELTYSYDEQSGKLVIYFDNKKLETRSIVIQRSTRDSSLWFGAVFLQEGDGWKQEINYYNESATYIIKNLLTYCLNLQS